MVAEAVGEVCRQLHVFHQPFVGGEWQSDMETLEGAASEQFDGITDVDHSACGYVAGVDDMCEHACYAEDRCTAELFDVLLRELLPLQCRGAECVSHRLPA